MDYFDFETNHILCSRPPCWEFASLSHLRRSAESESALAAAARTLPLHHIMFVHLVAVLGLVVP